MPTRCGLSAFVSSSRGVGEECCDQVASTRRYCIALVDTVCVFDGHLSAKNTYIGGGRSRAPRNGDTRVYTIVYFCCTILQVCRKEKV